jgi:hypothetical protein
MDDYRTDRLGVLLDQLDCAREIAQARLDGLASPASLPEGAPLPPRKGDEPLTDEEYLWEPAPGAWSIRRRGEAMSPKPFGPGEWQIDDAPGDPDPTPVTTIAWRLGHLHLDFAGTWEWTFGGRRQPPAELQPLGRGGAGAVLGDDGPLARQRRGRDPRAARHRRLQPVPLQRRRRVAVHHRHLGGQPRVHPPPG